MQTGTGETFDDLDEMEVTNPTMALELLAKDAHPLQQYRELTQNAIETILSTSSRTGTFLWDADWSHVELAGVYRLDCVDDGRGMTEEEMREHLNTLFSSGREQGVADNFGVGGKVTAGARNPAGVACFSWTPEESGLHCLFRRAGGPGSRYGLHRKTLPDGTNRGHTAALFQSELYDLVDQQRHRLQMQGFGILYAAKRVVVYIEPTVEGATANTARSSLTIRGNELPWESWGKQFGIRLPREIRELEREVRDATAERDHARSLQERLRRYKHLWKVTSWRANQAGPDRATGGAPSGASRQHENANDRAEAVVGDRPPQPLGADAPRGRGTTRNDYLSLLQDDGQPAERINPRREIPTVDWVDFEEDDDRPHDRAAEYVRAQNVIFAHTRFRVFTDMINQFTEELGGMHDDAPAEIRDAVREWYEQVLVEAVLRSWSFEHEAPWQRQEYDRSDLARSPDARRPAVHLRSREDQGQRAHPSQRAGRIRLCIRSIAACRGSKGGFDGASAGGRAVDRLRLEQAPLRC